MRRWLLLAVLAVACSGHRTVTRDASKDMAVDQTPADGARDGTAPDGTQPDQSTADQALSDVLLPQDVLPQDVSPPDVLLPPDVQTPDGPPTPLCAAQDAVGEGDCYLLLGWAWNGSVCVALSGCSCKGSDCGSLYSSPGACAASYYGNCLCPEQDIMGEGPCAAFIGVRWDGQRCENVGGCSCIGADCNQMYSSSSDCEQANETCICAPMDIEAVGNCKMLLGVTWDGSACLSLGGCSCDGSDCNRLYPPGGGTCEADHQICLAP